MRTKEVLFVRKQPGVLLGHRHSDHLKMDNLMKKSDAIIEDYESGMFISQICKKYHVSRSTFRKFRLQLNVERREQDCTNYQ